MEAFMHLTIGKAPWTTEAYAEMILASEDVGIFVLMELRQIILDGKGMPANTATTVAIPIFYGKGDIINCGVYIGVQLLEHAMKIVEKLLEKWLRNVVTTEDMLFGFVTGNGTIDAVLFQGGHKKNS